MSPKIGAMTIQVFQDQVDGLARVFGPPALGALPAQRSLEALERRSDLVELLRRGVFLFEPENRAQTVKQIGAFGKSLQKQEERRLVLFKRAQHALESFQRFEDLGVGRRCAKESSEGGQEMQAAGGEIEPGKIEGKTQTASIRVIVQCPLRHAAHGDDALDAFRKGRSVAFCGQPVIESLSPPTDRFSQMAALLADEGAQAISGSGGSHRVVDGVLLLASPCRYRRENADDRPARESASSGIAHIGQRPRS